METLKLTIARAIEIQQEHLAQWKTVLQPDAFAALKQWTEERNEIEANPHELRRGNDLSNFVGNLAIRKHREEWKRENELQSLKDQNAHGL